MPRRIVVADDSGPGDLAARVATRGAVAHDPRSWRRVALARRLVMERGMRRTVFVAVLSLSAAACVDAVQTDEASDAVAGTPDELALTRFLNDASTTESVLDVQVALDKRAAHNLVAHRNGADGVLGTADDDLFDSSAEVDAIPYVGMATMTKLTAYANAGGWVKDGELFGTFDGVPFTVAQARATIPYVNSASVQALDGSVGLDARAVKSIVAARPIATLAQLSSLYYVGASALTKIRNAASPSTCDDRELLAQLKATTPGMLLLSESDYPLDVVSWPGQGAAGATPAAFLQLLDRAPSTSIVPDTFDHMMTRFGYESDAAKVEQLRALFQDNLTDLHVWQVDLIQVHDYVVGVSKCGALIGVTAISIET
jgi:hypothetical protein